jgi:small membrane protein
MFIQLALISIFLALFLKILRQRSLGKIFRIVCAALVLVACCIVAFPSVANRVAAVAGVGRGADLIMYLCMAVGAYLMIVLYIRLKRNELSAARLVQRLAIETHRLEELELRIHGKPQN